MSGSDLFIGYFGGFCALSTVNTYRYSFQGKKVLDLGKQNIY